MKRFFSGHTERLQTHRIQWKRSYRLETLAFQHLRNIVIYIVLYIYTYYNTKASSVNYFSKNECNICLHHSFTPKKNVKGNFRFWTASLKPPLWPFALLLLKMLFPHAGHMAAHWTAVYPPHFSIWQPHWAPAAVAPNWLSLISHSEEKQDSSCLFWSKWIIHGKGRPTCLTG